MSGRSIAVGGRRVWLEESGGGRPLVWLHGFADVHGATAGLLPFHQALAAGRALIAPAHPGCADSTEDETLESIDDTVFHYLELFDALGLDEFDLAGACIGGWIAAEIAVRNRERVGRLVLVGARIGFSPPYFYHPKLRDRLVRFHRPALVVHGADDHMVPGDHAEAYAAGFPDARLEIMAGCGHSPHRAKPDTAAALVTAFLDG